MIGVDFQTMPDDLPTKRDTFYTLGSDVIPESYDVNLDINWHTLEYNGKVILRGKLTQSKDDHVERKYRIQFHSHEHEFKNIFLKFNGDMKTPVVAKKLDSDLFELRDSKTGSRDFLFDTKTCGYSITIEIDFATKINNSFSGLYVNELDKNSGDLVAGEPHYATTQCEPAGCQKIFPCIDAPAAKATFRLTIAIDKRVKAVSNMDIIVPKEPKVREDGKVLYEFETTPIMSTYLIGIFLGDFVSVEAKSSRGVTMRIYTRPMDVKKTQFAKEVAPKMLDFFENYYKIDYIMKKLDSISVDKFECSAMENFGVMSFRKSALLVTPDTRTEDKRMIAQVIAHEIAHQWFGNLVTMVWWSDLWLNEGFATFTMYKCVSEVCPELDGEDFFLNTRLFTGHIIDSLHSSHPISMPIETIDDINSNFDAISYNKAASYLRMLNGFVTEELFRKGVTHYLDTYKYSNADYINFIEAINSQVPQFDLVKISQKFLLDKNCPIICVQRIAKQNGNDGKIQLTQSRFVRLGLDLKSEKPEDVYMIPMLVKRVKADCTFREESCLMDLQRKTVDLEDDEELIIVNSSTNGFYLAIYSPEELAKIVRFSHILTDLDFYSIIMSHALVVLSHIEQSLGEEALGELSVFKFVEFVENVFDRLGASSYTLLTNLMTYFHSVLCHDDRKQSLYDTFIRSKMLPLYRKLEAKPQSQRSSVEESLMEKLLQLLVDFGVQEIVDELQRDFKSLQETPGDLISIQSRLLLEKCESDEECRLQFEKLFTFAKTHEDQTVKQSVLRALPHANSASTRHKLYDMLINGEVEYMNSRYVTPTIGASTETCREFGEYLLKTDSIGKLFRSMPTILLTNFFLSGFKSLDDVKMAEKLQQCLIDNGLKATRPIEQMVETVKINDKLKSK